jgi:hypothetical protein
MQATTFKIEAFIPNSEQLKNYSQEFKNSLPNWNDSSGDPVFIDIDGCEQDAMELRKMISEESLSTNISLLKKFNVYPHKLYQITEISSGFSKTLPIYTGIKQVSLEGHGAILAEAFFGTEIHLLDAAGRILWKYKYNFSPQLGIGNLVRKSLDSEYDKNPEIPDTYFSSESIVDYSPSDIKKSISFSTQKGEIYYVTNEYKTTEVIHGTGDLVYLSNLHSLGWYQISNVNSNELPFSTEYEKILHFHIGLEWKEISDFTITYNTFPFLNDRDNWIMQNQSLSKEDIYKLFFNKCKDDLFILDQLENNPCSFQFMPTEIRSNTSWVEKFCLKEPVNFLFVDNILRNNLTFVIDLIEKTDRDKYSIYPYLSEKLRKNIDVLLVMKKHGRLFDLPDKDDVGTSKLDDIRSFILENKSRLVDVIEIFPNALKYLPNELEFNEDDFSF